MYQCQGHPITRQGQTRLSVINEPTIGRIETKLGVRVDIDESYKLVQGQGH